ncbi:hypothetical protein VP01_5784g1 [Puccinia sorghi]|uniref:Uncharacterized protein n=1 Tax=Puccinia sorghi TaxID=27349 RepID=A0A0L6UIA4_9BASI|nr:hypothetical protein VP01_5784g1 [Puccinia sorghi]
MEVPYFFSWCYFQASSQVREFFENNPIIPKCLGYNSSQNIISENFPCLHGNHGKKDPNQISSEDVIRDGYFFLVNHSASNTQRDFNCTLIIFQFIKYLASGSENPRAGHIAYGLSMWQVSSNSFFIWKQKCSKIGIQQDNKMTLIEKETITTYATARQRNVEQNFRTYYAVSMFNTIGFQANVRFYLMNACSHHVPYIHKHLSEKIIKTHITKEKMMAAFIEGNRYGRKRYLRLRPIKKFLPDPRPNKPKEKASLPQPNQLQPLIEQKIHSQPIQLQPLKNQNKGPIIINSIPSSYHYLAKEKKISIAEGKVQWLSQDHFSRSHRSKT